MAPVTPVIDVHSHLLPEEAWTIPLPGGDTVITERQGSLYLGETPIAVGRGELSDVEILVADMDRAGIGVRVVTAPPYAFPTESDETSAARYCEQVTDALLNACASHPDRLVPFGMVPLCSAEGAREAMRSLADRGLRGVLVPALVGGRPLGEGLGRSVLEAAATLGLAVLVHPVQGPRPELSTHYLRNLIGNPYETAVAVASVALSGTLAALPDLRLLFVHAAGCAPALVGRWDHGWKQRDDVGVPGLDAPSRELRDSVFVDSLAHHPLAAGLARDVFGPAAVTLGSDYPFDMGDPDPVASAVEAGLDVDQLSRNALRWLGISSAPAVDADRDPILLSRSV